MLPDLVRRLLSPRSRRHLPLHGGPADGLTLAVPRPAPPWVFAALRPMVDGRILLATASDEMGLYVSTSGEPTGVARYRLDGPRYRHVIDEHQVPFDRPA